MTKKDIKYGLLFQNKFELKTLGHICPVSVMFGNTTPGRVGYLSWWHVVNTK